MRTMTEQEILLILKNYVGLTKEQKILKLDQELLFQFDSGLNKQDLIDYINREP